MILISWLKPKKDGNLPISRFFRRIFESKHIRFILGINLIISAFFVSGFSSPTVASNVSEAVLLRPAENVLTEISFKQPILGNTTQGYNWYHQAVDIANEVGISVYPTANGVVKETEYGFLGYGHKIIIEHVNSYWTLYAHLQEIRVKPGDVVTKDTIIGTIGVTGWTTGPHLHFEIHQGDRTLNPVDIFPELINGK